MDQTLRTEVLTRDGYRCVRCGDDITFQRHSVHHRRLKKQGGRDEPANLITLCGSGTEGCHFTVHSKRAEIGEPGGYIVPSWAEPAETPVRYARRGTVWLT